MATAASSGASGASGADCDGEDQDDSSSSSSSPPSPSHDVIETTEEFNALTVNDNSQIKDPADELTAFREQWQRELEATPSPQREEHNVVQEFLSDEDKAKQLFLRGAEMERGGRLYEAVHNYRRAIQILPDVETRLYESEARDDTPEVESEAEEICREDNPESSDDEDAVEGEDLLSRLQRGLARRGRLCDPAYAVKGAHISWLPYEVLLLVARWVVSSELDAMSLERLGATCRGLYVLAREPDLWRSLCVKTWGIECGTPRAAGFTSWRGMYIERPRLHLHGCYISKTTYLRHGENSFQDQFYRPWYLIDYYRYLRFFPDGLVLTLTTPEEPHACVSQLRQRQAKVVGVTAGHYRLMGNKVVIVIKKCNGDKKSANSRFRSRRKDAHEPQDQSFHLELELRNVRSRRNFQLMWTRYSVCTRRDQWTHFELSPNKFPPFAFSRVRAYTADATAPLASTHAYT